MVQNRFNFRGCAVVPQRTTSKELTHGGQRTSSKEFVHGAVPKSRLAKDLGCTVLDSNPVLDISMECSAPSESPGMPKLDDSIIKRDDGAVKLTPHRARMISAVSTGTSSSTPGASYSIRDSQDSVGTNAASISFNGAFAGAVLPAHSHMSATSLSGIRAPPVIHHRQGLANY